ncbi:MAG: succinyl-diaminopimelate desuccinylase [Actinomycetales bacterium]|nr:succinyl-diaminopimelate desuccinylase [Actinomycetales bacterium]
MLNLQADVAQITEQLVNVPSISGNEAALADAIETQLRNCSWLTVTRISNSVIAQTNFGLPNRVVLAGHIDTVPAAQNTEAVLVSAGQALPTGEVMTEEVIFGLGGCDMKAGVAVALKAALTISQPTVDVTYVFYECEEVDSSRNGLTLISNSHPELLSADIAVLLEPSNAVIEAGCQGTLKAEIHASGKRSHSARSWLGVNAIHALAPALEILANHQADRVMVDGLEYREGLSAVGISGGIAGNVIPDQASLTVNYRYAPSTSADEAAAKIISLFSDFEVTIIDNAPGALPGLTEPALSNLLQLVGGEVFPKFGWTDVSRFARLGIPAVNFGPGDPALAHSASEHVPTSHIHRVANLITQWLTK